MVEKANELLKKAELLEKFMLKCQKVEFYGEGVNWIHSASEDLLNMRVAISNVRDSIEEVNSKTNSKDLQEAYINKFEQVLDRYLNMFPEYKSKIVGSKSK